MPHPTPHMTQESEARIIARENLILLTQAGSVATGLNVPGTADRDLMGVCIEPPSYVIGLRVFEQDVQRDKPMGVRSDADDTESVIYSARKFCSLALKGNPLILAALFAPVEKITPAGQSLRDLAPSFASKRAGKAFLGYMVQQREKMMGKRGQMNVKRPELIEAYGFDTKYAMHILRLGTQGVEYMTTGRLTFPMPEPGRSNIYSVRVGEHDLPEVMEMATELERQLEDLLETSPLPDAPDRQRVEEWLIRTYTEHWKAAKT